MADGSQRAPGTVTLSEFDGRKTLAQLEAEKAEALEKEERFRRIPMLYPEVERQYSGMLNTLSGDARNRALRKLAETLYDKMKKESAGLKPKSPLRPEEPTPSAAPAPTPEPQPAEEPILEAEPMVEVILDEPEPALQELPDSLRPGAWAEWGSTPLNPDTLARFTNEFGVALGKALNSLTPEQLKKVEGMHRDVIFNMYSSAQTEAVDPKFLKAEIDRAIPSYWSATLDSARLMANIK